MKTLRLAILVLFALSAIAQERPPQEKPAPEKQVPPKPGPDQESAQSKQERGQPESNTDLLAQAARAGHPTGLKPLDIFNLRSASDPQISPDGKRIVYVRNFNDIMADKRCSNLWIMNTDGSDERPLTTGVQRDTSPRWSPDGTRVAYISDEDGHSQIYVRWMDSGQTARITALQFTPAGLEWSPDGKQLAFNSFVITEPYKLATIPKAPAGAKWAESPTIYDRSVYRFNGAGYLKPGFTHVFVVSADGGVPRQITSGNFQYGGPTAGGASSADWAPDSKFLVLSANRHPDYELNPRDTEVYEFNIDTGAVRQLTDRRGPDSGPQVSHNGRLIAYTGFDDHFQGYQVVHLYVMNRDGSGAHEISGKLDRDPRELRWAADDSGLYFIYDDQGDTKLAFITLNGDVRKIADHLGSGASAYAGGASFSVSNNGTVAYTETLPDMPGEVAVVGAKGTPRVLTAVNHDLLAQRKLGKVEEIWYPSSKDGRKIQGWIITPPDFNPAKKYPLILEIHGGPFANYGDRFDVEKQIWASSGYVIFYANPRGSTSYGAEFGNLIHHAYPGDDFYDLNSGVDAVIAKGYIDPANVFVTGGSGGGVLTCWMIDRTTRFKAAASLYPVIDWYSFALTSDIPITVVKYWFPGMPWDYPQQYAERSVISLVKNVKTPTLLMTGESDFRTPIGQAEEYYEALRLLNVPAVLVRVPDEPHGLSQHPSHHLTKVMYVQGWFDRHRTGAPQPAERAAGD